MAANTYEEFPPIRYQWSIRGGTRDRLSPVTLENDAGLRLEIDGLLADKFVAEIERRREAKEPEAAYVDQFFCRCVEILGNASIFEMTSLSLTTR